MVGACFVSVASVTRLLVRYIRTVFVSAATTTCRYGMDCSWSMSDMVGGASAAKDRVLGAK
jgi:hypothetical protein